MFEEAFGKSLDRMKESFLYAAALGGNLDDCSSLLSLGGQPHHTGTYHHFRLIKKLICSECQLAKCKW